MAATELHRRDRHAAALIALALLVASYLLFSMRTLLDPVDPGELISAKRLIATAVGATTFWLIATRWHWLFHPAVTGRLWRAAVLLLAALAPVLATRIGYDLLVSGETEALWASNVRWLLAWSGYFVAALLGYRLLTRPEAAQPRSEPPAWSDDDYLAHLVGEADGPRELIAYELKR